MVALEAAVALLCVGRLLQQHSNAASASGDPCKLPSIQMNHTDGLYNSTQLHQPHLQHVSLHVHNTGLEKPALDSSVPKLEYMLYQTSEPPLKAPGLKLGPQPGPWRFVEETLPGCVVTCEHPGSLSGSTLVFAAFMQPLIMNLEGQHINSCRNKNLQPFLKRGMKTKGGTSVNEVSGVRVSSNNSMDRKENEITAQ